MAIVKNFYLRNQRKKLGGAVYYQAMGQTRSRELAAEVSNPRTPAQMAQRVRWANLVNLYRANKGWMKYAYETKKTNQSDYNKFMSLNVASSNIYLPKDIANAGGCVVQAYQITQGSLPSIETVYSAGSEAWLTNIYLPQNFELTQKTVAQVSAALIENNPALQEGDQLSFIRMTQMTNAYNGAPYVIVRKYEVILSLTNNSSWQDYMPNEYIGVASNVGLNGLCVNNSGQAGGFAMILSRTIAGKTYVSSQPIVVANNSALIAAFSSASALENAISSYGETSEPFLSSTFANQFAEESVPNSIVSLTADTNRLVPGTFFNITKALAAKNLRIVFSSSYGENTTQIRVGYMANGNENFFVMSTISLQEGTLLSVFPAADALPADAACTSILVTTEDGDVYEASFFVPNSYTIHGLE